MFARLRKVQCFKAVLFLYRRFRLVWQSMGQTLDVCDEGGQTTVFDSRMNKNETMYYSISFRPDSILTKEI